MCQQCHLKSLKEGTVSSPGQQEPKEIKAGGKEKVQTHGKILPLWESSSSAVVELVRIETGGAVKCESHIRYIRYSYVPR